MKTISLEKIVQKLEETSDADYFYLNTVTGEFEWMSNGEYMEADEELAERIEMSDDYVRLPTQYDIHEYLIMRDFAESIEDDNIREKLCRTLTGSRVHRRFKDELIFLGIREEYYAFRNTVYWDIAEEWCKDHKIPYIGTEV